jgi:Ca-activated chloride channel homolog
LWSFQILVYLYMFRFEHPQHLWALLFLPLAMLSFQLLKRQRATQLKQFSAEKMWTHLFDFQEDTRRLRQFILLLSGLFFLIVGWANPQWGERKEEVNGSKSDVFIALDISLSMYCNDVSPNRLDRAKLLANELTEALKGDRVGLILFAGNAYLQMPLTNDASSAQLFINSANPDQAPSQGTAIGEAIALAEKGFPAENKRGKALIVLSDGEDQEEDALETAKTAHDNGLVVCTVGVGTPEGGFIPQTYAGQSGLKMDESGQPVRTKINESMLQSLASTCEGKYYNILSGEAAIAADIQRLLSKLEKTDSVASRQFVAKESYFQWFIGFGLLLLLLNFVFTKK